MPRIFAAAGTSSFTPQPAARALLLGGNTGNAVGGPDHQFGPTIDGSESRRSMRDGEDLADPPINQSCGQEGPGLPDSRRVKLAVQSDSSALPTATTRSASSGTTFDRTAQCPRGPVRERSPSPEITGSESFIHLDSPTSLGMLTHGIRGFETDEVIEVFIDRVTHGLSRAKPRRQRAEAGGIGEKQASGRASTSIMSDIHTGRTRGRMRISRSGK